MSKTLTNTNTDFKIGSLIRFCGKQFPNDDLFKTLDIQHTLRFGFPGKLFPFSIEKLVWFSSSEDVMIIDHQHKNNIEFYKCLTTRGVLWIESQQLNIIE